MLVRTRPLAEGSERVNLSPKVTQQASRELEGRSPVPRLFLLCLKEASSRKLALIQPEVLASQAMLC